MRATAVFVNNGADNSMLSRETPFRHGNVADVPSGLRAEQRIRLDGDGLAEMRLQPLSGNLAHRKQMKRGCALRVVAKLVIGRHRAGSADELIGFELRSVGVAGTNQPQGSDQRVAALDRLLRL